MHDQDYDKDNDTASICFSMQYRLSLSTILIRERVETMLKVQHWLLRHLCVRPKSDVTWTRSHFSSPLSRGKILNSDRYIDWGIWVNLIQ